jgi:hypothetical protein
MAAQTAVGFIKQGCALLHEGRMELEDAKKVKNTFLPKTLNQQILLVMNGMRLKHWKMVLCL